MKPLRSNWPDIILLLHNYGRWRPANHQDSPIHSRPEPADQLIGTGEIDPSRLTCLAVAEAEAGDHGRIGAESGREIINVIQPRANLPLREQQPGRCEVFSQENCSCFSPRSRR